MTITPERDLRVVSSKTTNLKSLIFLVQHNETKKAERLFLCAKKLKSCLYREKITLLKC